MKAIWLPKSEMRVTVCDGKVTVTESMQMYEKKVGDKKPGFEDRT